MIEKTIKFCAAALLSATTVLACAHPLDGYWFPDMALTKKALAQSDPPALATICKRMTGDGFYLISLLVSVRIDGNRLQVILLGGGPVETALLLSADENAGKWRFHRPPEAAEQLQIDVESVTQKSILVRVAGRNNPELNAVYWTQRSATDMARMGADFLAGKNDVILALTEPCQ